MPVPMLTRRKAVGMLAERLTGLYDPCEARSIARQAAAFYAGITLPALLADPEAEIDAPELEQAAERLAAGEPLQYVLGESEFFGRRFAVRKGVLIPRPETEELAALVVRRERGRAPRLLDIGTGSGCLAVTLALELRDAEVWAADISEEALAVAGENARALGARVAFRRADALHDLAERFDGPFDLLVSNPPYVPESDRAAMHTNVRDHEPALALFVPDDDRIRFYRAIARAGQLLLRPGGRLYFEIYEHAAEEIVRMLGAEGYTGIEVHEDLNGKARMTCAARPE